MTAKLQNIVVRVRADELSDPDCTGCVGVYIEATIAIPYRDSSIIQTITTPGVWGIDNESDETYLRSIATEEHEILCSMLATLHIYLPEEALSPDYNLVRLIYA